MGPHRVFRNELMSPTIASAGNPMSRMSVASLGDLGYQALIPERNLVRPAPNHFTHELVVDEPYHFHRPDQLDEPDGVLPARTQVALLAEGDERSRVVAGNGLYVEVRRASCAGFQTVDPRSPSDP